MNTLTHSFNLYAEQLSKNRQLLQELFQANSSFSYQLSSEQKRAFFKNNIDHIVLHYYQHLKSNKFMSKISEQMIAYFKKCDLTQILCDFNDWLTVYQNMDAKIQKSNNLQIDSNIYQIINSYFLTQQQKSKLTQTKCIKSKQSKKQSLKADKGDHHNLSKDCKQNNTKNKSIQVSKQEKAIKVKDKSIKAHGNINTSKDKEIKNDSKSTNKEITKKETSLNPTTTLYKQKYQNVKGNNEYIQDWNNDKLLFEGMPWEVTQCLSEGDHKRQNRILLAHMLVQPQNASKYSFLLRRINHCHLSKQQ